MSVCGLSWNTIFPVVPARYRQPWYGQWDRRFFQCLVASGSLGLIALLLIYTQPYQPAKVVHMEDLSPRFAKLVREVDAPPPMPVAAPIKETTRSSGALPWANGVPKAAPGPPGPLTPRPGARGPGHGPGSGGGSGGGVGNGGGVAGRNLSAALAGAQQSLGKTLDGLSASLAPAGGSGPGAPTGVGANSTGASGGVSARRSPRGGRSAADLALAGGNGSGAPGQGGGEGSGDGRDKGEGTSSLAGALVSVESVLPLGGANGGAGGGGGDGGGGGGGGGTSVGGRRRGGASGAGESAAPRAYRTNASLLAVVRRNAAGIQFCYDNELKHAPGLRGKLTIAMTVAPSGEVTEVTATGNSVGSPELLACVLAQIREWRFTAIPDGETRFQVPFVFTPPK